MKKYLESKKLDKEIIEIYTQCDISSFDVCNIIAVDENYVFCVMYDKHGNFDGYSCFQIDSIFLIKEKTPYLKNLKSLIKYTPSTNWSFANNCDLLTQIFDYCKKNDLICSFEIDDSGCNDLLGNIETYDDSSLVIKVIDEVTGKEDGVAFLLRNVITCVSIESECLDKVKKLNSLPV